MKREYSVTVNDKSFEVTLIKKTGDTVLFEVNGNSYLVTIEPKLTASATPTQTNTQQGPRIVRSEQPVSITDPSAISSPLPGIVIKLLVKTGDEVSVGQPVAIIEAMKMENVVSATFNGTIHEVLVTEGEEVKKGQALLK